MQKTIHPQQYRPQHRQTNKQQHNCNISLIHAIVLLLLLNMLHPSKHLLRRHRNLVRTLLPFLSLPLCSSLSTSSFSASAFASAIFVALPFL